MNSTNLKELACCPFCQGDFEIQKVKCRSCNSEITGSFAANRFQLLATDQLYFVELFLRNEGNIRQMEKELNISYPTVKNRLHQIIEKLGYSSKPENKKISILNRLSSGEIDVQEALKQLTPISENKL